MDDNEMDDNEDVHEARGPYHNFWLFREGERTYKEYRDLLGRRDAPVRISDDVIQYIYHTLQWVPTHSPVTHRKQARDRIDHGLHTHGETILNRASGERLQKICAGWAQVLSQGPETLELMYRWTFIIDDEGKRTGRQYGFRISRDKLVEDLEKLAGFGGLIASGDYFLFHLGV